MTNGPEGDKVPLISREMIIYIRLRAHTSNELSLLLEAFKRSQLKGMGCGGIWDWIPHSYSTTTTQMHQSQGWSAPW